MALRFAEYIPICLELNQGFQGTESDLLFVKPIRPILRFEIHKIKSVLLANPLFQRPHKLAAHPSSSEGREKCDTREEVCLLWADGKPGCSHEPVVDDIAE